MNARFSRQNLAICFGFLVLQGLLVGLYQSAWWDKKADAEIGFACEQLAPVSAPPLQFEALDGTRHSLAAFRGKSVLLHFWATWCAPCRQELPGLLALGRELASEHQIQVIAVSLDSDWEEVREQFSGDVPNEIMRGDVAAITRDLGLTTLPDTYLVSAEGLVRARIHGARDWQSRRAREVLVREWVLGRGKAP